MVTGLERRGCAPLHTSLAGWPDPSAGPLLRAAPVDRIRWTDSLQHGRGTCGKEARIGTATDDEEFETYYPGEEDEQGFTQGRGKEGEGELSRSAEGPSQTASTSTKGRSGGDVGSHRRDVGSSTSAGSQATSLLGSDWRVGRLQRRRQGTHQAGRSACDHSRQSA